MTPPALSRRDHRAVLLGLALLAPALLYLGAVKPYAAALTQAQDHLTAERETLARERALLALAPHSTALRGALDSVLHATQARLFEARDDGLAAAELVAYLARLARRSEVRLQAADTRETTVPPNGVRALPVEIRAESDFEGMLTFLRALEAGTKLVRVDQLSLVPGATTSASRRALEMRATVVGYALGDALGDAPPSRPTRPQRRTRP